VSRNVEFLYRLSALLFEYDAEIRDVGPDTLIYANGQFEVVRWYKATVVDANMVRDAASKEMVAERVREMESRRG